MADVQGFLTRKLGPLPVWAWAAAGGGIVSVLYLRGKGQGATPAGMPAGTPGDMSGQGLFAPSPIIVTPNTMPSQTSSANPSTPTSSSVPAVFTGAGTMGLTGGKSGTSAIRSAPTAYSPAVTQAPPGTKIQVNSQGVPDPQSSWGQWYQIVQGPGVGFWAWGQDISLTPGMGGGGTPTVIKTLPGAGRVGRFTSRHAHPQYLNVGMGGGGRHGLRAVSQRTGLPEARLMALNPGQWRPTPGPRPRHIHIR